MYKDYLHMAAVLVSRNSYWYQWHRARCRYLAQQIETPTHYNPTLLDASIMTQAYVDLAENLSKQYRSAWETHPDYYPSREPLHIECVWVFKHPAGIQGRTYSYGVGPIDDEDALRWMMKRGSWELVDCLPVAVNIPVDRTQILVLPFDMPTSTWGYHCRMELKRLLPPKLRPLVSKLRRSRQKRKVDYLANDLKRYGYVANATDVLMYRNGTLPVPEWFRKVTTKDLWIAAQEESLWKETRQILYYIRSMSDFYDILFGKVHPESVLEYFHRIPSHAVKKDVQLGLWE